MSESNWALAIIGFVTNLYCSLLVAMAMHHNGQMRDFKLTWMRSFWWPITLLRFLIVGFFRSIGGR